MVNKKTLNLNVSIYNLKLECINLLYKNKIIIKINKYNSNRFPTTK